MLIGNDPSCVSDAARMAGRVYIVTDRAKLLWVPAVENVATIKQIVRIINNEKSNLNMHVHFRYITRHIPLPVTQSSLLPSGMINVVWA